MSNTVDNRAVHLGFDNKQFESGVKQSTSSLDSLKKSLNFDEQTKSLQNFANAGKTLNLSSISDGVQNISNRFSALGIIGMQVLQNLTNSVMQLGHKMWTSITDPAKKGFSEYEVQMNSIQTIMANTASKGTTLQQVNDILEEMNKYADQTIYSFPEMARNMGTFTAAGIELKTAGEAIKGIANLAAVSGSNSMQASTAMYQLSQALAAGTVKLMDWNSVVNAGMGGQVFQDALKETARLHKVNIDDMIKREGSFRNTLQEGWLTSEILTETLSKFTGDLTAAQLETMGYTEEQIAGILKLGETAKDAATKVKTLSQLKETMQEALSSGWAKSWQIIFGDFGEAKEFFTFLSDNFGKVIQGSADSRNAILQGWKDLGGRTMLIQSIMDVFKSAGTIINIFKAAWEGWFPDKGKKGETLFKITELLKKFTDALKPTGSSVVKIVAVIGGFMAVLDIIRMGIVAVLPYIQKLIGSFSGKVDAGGLVDYIVGVAYALVDLNRAIKTGDYFNKKIQEISVFLNKFKEDFLIVTETIQSRFEGLKESFNIFKNNLKEAFSFEKVDTAPLDGFFDKLQKRFDFKPLQTLLKIINFVFDGLVSLLEKTGPSILKMGSFLGKVLGKLGTGIMKAVGELNFNELLDTLNTGLIGGLIIALTKFVNSGSLQAITGMFSGVSGILDQVRVSLQAYQENLKSKTLLNIAIAVGILAASLLVISMIDSEKLTKALFAITTLFADLVLSMSALGAGGGGMGGAAGLSATLIAMSLSLLLLTASIKALSDIDQEELKNGLASLGAISAGLVAFMQLLGSNAKSFVGSAVSLILVAVAINMLVGVVEKLGSLKIGVIQQGLLALGIIFTEIAAFTQLAGKNVGISAGLGMIAVVGSILLMAKAVELFGNMDIDILKQGLLTIGIILAELALFTRLTGNGKNLIATGIGTAILAGAMLIFAEALTRIGDLSIDELQRGLLGMAGALLAIVLAVNLMPKNILVIAASLAIIAGAIYILGMALSSMGDMTWEEIGKGLATLAGALLIIGIAMYAMQGAMGGAIALIVVAGAIAILAPALKMLGGMGLGEIALALGALAAMFVILGIAGAVLTPVVPTLFGLAMSIMLIGAAVALIGAGLLLFSAGLAALAISGVAGATAFVAVVGILLGLIPMILTALGEAIILLAKLLIEAIPVVAEALIVLIAALCLVIIESVPDILAALTVLLEALWVLIREQVPQAVDAILYVIGELLKSLAESIPDFTQSAFDILIGFLKGIRDNIAEVVTTVGEIVVAFLDALALELPKIIQAGFDTLIAFINGITKAIEENGPDLSKAIGDLASAIIKGLTDGLLGGVSSIVTAIGNIGSSIISALKTLLGIASPSTVTYEMGKYLSLGLAKGIDKYAVYVANSAEDMSKKAINGMNGAIKRISSSLNSNLDVNPTIRPVLDLTGIQNGSKNIDSILGTKSIPLVTNMNNLSSVAANMASRNNPNDGINKGAEQSATVIFNQTNTSPKALSAFDIYRNTRNQLLMAKGLVLNQ